MNGARCVFGKNPMLQENRGPTAGLDDITRFEKNDGGCGHLVTSKLPEIDRKACAELCDSDALAGLDADGLIRFESVPNLQSNCLGQL
jgi:hypothetical protein